MRESQAVGERGEALSLARDAREIQAYEVAQNLQEWATLARPAVSNVAISEAELELLDELYDRV